MLQTWPRVLVALTMGALAVAACGGDDADPPADGDAGGPGTAVDEAEAPENTCSPDQVARLPETVDPEGCWAAPGATDPVILQDAVFALVEDASVGGESPPASVVAYDQESGAQMWSSDPLPGQVRGLSATEVEGEPAIAALVLEEDEGDAVTEASQSWGYLVWPATVGDGDPAEPTAHITAPAADPSVAEIRWTDQGLLVGDQFLAPGADEFVPAQIAPDPIMVGDYDLDESFAGVSGEVMLSYVRGVAWGPGASDEGDSYVGWVARGLDGVQAWDAVESTPNEGENAIGAEGLTDLALVVGDYALTITPTDESYAAFETSWVDAATGQPAEPRPADLAGAEAVAASSDVVAGGTAALASADGRYLAVSWSTLAVVLDVESGEVARVESDFEIGLDAADDVTVYGSTQNGALTISWSDATATALEPPQQSPADVDGVYGAVSVAAEAVTGEDTLLVAGLVD
jgi:hypothetical protein